jgi:hypothetical protein
MGSKVWPGTSGGESSPGGGARWTRTGKYHWAARPEGENCDGLQFFGHATCLGVRPSYGPPHRAKLAELQVALRMIKNHR